MVEVSKASGGLGLNQPHLRFQHLLVAIVGRPIQNQAGEVNSPLDKRSCGALFWVWKVENQGYSYIGYEIFVPSHPGTCVYLWKAREYQEGYHEQLECSFPVTMPGGWDGRGPESLPCF